MQQQLKIAIIQSDLVWENPEQNRQNFAEKIKKIKEPVDIIVLPEMFTSGFTMNPEHVSETMDGQTIAWMKEIAIRSNAAVCGSLVISENEHYYNRFVFATPEDDIKYYDKRHTFTLAGENKVYKAGSERVIINYKGWKICSLVCYDLRFPVWARNTDDYDVVMYVANWPKPRINAWDALLKARAIENMSYGIGVNRVGFDNNSYEYPGHSAVYDGLGECITSMKPNAEQIAIVTLEKNHLETIRQKLKFLYDRDAFTLK
ncbi:MAG: omega-amidase [Glaciecola sp.]|jgi:omega-amidase